MSSEPISLAEWIASLRAELTEAAIWQQERVEAAGSTGASPLVPPLLLKELKLELNISTTRESGAKGGMKFWVLSAEGSMKESATAAQRVTLVLQPLVELHLGHDPGFLK